jgi:hypothetical protein
VRCECFEDRQVSNPSPHRGRMGMIRNHGQDTRLQRPVPPSRIPLSIASRW